jgi:hypothetical protein
MKTVHKSILPFVLTIVVSILTVTPNASVAQVTRTINHQGKLIDDNNDPVEGAVTVKFRLYDAPAEGVALWSEDHVVEAVNGIFEVVLGTVDSLDDVEFNQQLWLGVAVNDKDEMEPRLRLSTVPYAVRAERIDASALEAGDNVKIEVDGDVLRISAEASESGPGNSLDSEGGGLKNVVFVDNFGRVGIGTETPQFKLDVASSMRSFGNINAVGNMLAGGGITSLGDIEAQAKIDVSGDVIAGGDILLEDTDGTIRFPNSSADAAPMIELFRSGTNNPTRMVLAHSPNFRSWGIAYNDTTDSFQFVKDGSPVLVAALGLRRVGIGTSAPTERLHVKGGTLIEGDLDVSGKLSKSSGSFKIDHPLDRANKYLYHSFVESPEMMNVYNGNVVLDGDGKATVALPSYFGALNRDFRYQLTCIGGFAPVFVAEKIAGNEFRIAGGEPGMEVSWQVTGVRKDVYAEENRIEVEVDKAESERGTFLYQSRSGRDDLAKGER